MMEDIAQKNNAFFRQLLFIVILIVLALIIFKQLSFFIGAFLGAGTIYILLRKPLLKLTEQHGWKHWTAAITLVAAATTALLGLGYLIFEVIATEIPNINTSKIIGSVNGFLRDVAGGLGFKAIPESIITEAGGVISKIAASAINTTYSFAANMFMMVIILYFMLSAGRSMERGIIKYFPLHNDKLEMVKQEVKMMIFNNAVGIPLIMLMQTVTASLIYWILGIEGIFFWGFLTAIAGLIPVVGAGIIYVPLGLFLILNGDPIKGIILIAYGILIISNTDNVVRIVLMKKMGDTHPLIVIFGVILGIPLFGFWGIIFGPLMISGFLLLLKIYFLEYKLTRDVE